MVKLKAKEIETGVRLLYFGSVGITKTQDIEAEGIGGPF
jgi:hypothetical protein